MQLFQFRFYELGGGLGLGFSGLEILFQIKGGQGASHLLHHVRIFASIGDGEGNGYRRRLSGPSSSLFIGYLGADRIQFNIIAHLFGDLFPGKSFPQVRVEVKLIKNFPEFDPGENLLGQALDALVGKAGYRGSDLSLIHI